MRTLIHAITVLLIAMQTLHSDDLPIMVADSGSDNVDKLIAKVVSLRPHPFPPTGEIPEKLRDMNILPSGIYITDEVSAAIEQLELLVPASSLYLLAHLEDDRYSYSATLPSAVGPWGGWFEVSVGSVVRDVITGGFESRFLYKWRESAKGKGFTPPQFSDYLKTQGGLETWVKKNSKSSYAEVFTKFIDWCIVVEKERGFVSKDEEGRLEARYRAWKKEVEQVVAPDR